MNFLEILGALALLVLLGLAIGRAMGLVEFGFECVEDDE